MKILLILVAAWLALSTDLPAADVQPRIRFAPAEQIARLRYPNVKAAQRPRVVAVYHDEARTIYLHDKWSARTVADLSVLVHEMVHHLQNRAGLKYACAAAREKPAYAAQQRFLRFFGRNLRSEFGLDEITVKLSTNCLL